MKVHSKEKNQPTGFQRFIGDVKSFITKWNEAFLLILAIVLWCYSDNFLRWIDPTSATFDAGILQKFIYTIIGCCICHFTIWLMLRLTFPNIHSYMYEVFYWDVLQGAGDEAVLKAKSGDMQYKKYLLELRWKRINYSLVVFAFYLFTFLAILATV